MRKSVLCILLAVCWSFGLGCGEKPAKRKVASVEGITLQDVAPIDADEAKPEVMIHVISFDVPGDTWTSSGDIFKGLTTQPIGFANQKALNANGIAVSAGNNLTWPKVAEKLNAAGAVKGKTNKMLLYDELTNDMTVSRIATSDVDYVNRKGQESKVLLDGGILAWRMQARNHIAKSGVAIVKISTVFKHYLNPSLKKMAPQDMVEIELDANAFELAMSPGGFVMIGPGETEDKVNDIGKSLFNGKDGAVRLYLVLCVRVSN